LRGRVIAGDVAATLVDLAVRGLIEVDEGQNGQWLVRTTARKRPDHLPEYEAKLLDSAEPLGSCTPETLATLDHVRTALIKDAVHQGWVRHLHHDELTAAGEELVGKIGVFERGLKQLRAESGDDALSGSLLPFALRLHLIPRDQLPLARFAQAWVGAFGGKLGWSPERKPVAYDDGSWVPAYERATAAVDHW
jgi:hypothetical protein